VLSGDQPCRWRFQFFGDVTPCRPLNACRRLGRTITPVSSTSSSGTRLGLLDPKNPVRSLNPIALSFRVPFIFLPPRPVRGGGSDYLYATATTRGTYSSSADIEVSMERWRIVSRQRIRKKHLSQFHVFYQEFLWSSLDTVFRPSHWGNLRLITWSLWLTSGVLGNGVIQTQYMLDVQEGVRNSELIINKNNILLKVIDTTFSYSPALHVD
jgi:hypothetical protein